MPNLQFDGATYSLRDGETVLDCLLRNEISLAHSCKSGVCQSCLVRAETGTVPARAQLGLRDTLRAQGYMLACSCVPEGDLAIALIDSGLLRHRARIEAIDRLNDRVMRVHVRTEEPFAYRPGQYANLVRDDGLIRSYSIASVPEESDLLEFHVALMPEGKMSGWMHCGDAVGAAIDVMGPVGNCFYVPGSSEQPLFLAGTGTGLAPLYGIARDALRNSHAGDIHLFHGSVRPEGLYLVEELQALASEHDNFHYYACALEGTADGVVTAPIDTYSLGVVSNLKGHKVYLCGHPDTVRGMQRKVFLAGASLSAIYADAFLPSAAT